MADITALMVQGARAALQRTSDLVEVVLRSNPDRDDDEVAELKKTLRKPLIEAPKSHAPLFGADDAFKAGLPVAKAEPKGEQWEIIWALWAKYFALGPSRVYEGHSALKVLPWPTAE